MKSSGMRPRENVPKPLGMMKSVKPKEKFVVKKMLNIGSSSARGSNKGDNWRPYEARLSKKYLILQPMGE